MGRLEPSAAELKTFAFSALMDARKGLVHELALSIAHGQVDGQRLWAKAGATAHQLSWAWHVLDAKHHNRQIGYARRKRHHPTPMRAFIRE